MNAPGADRYDVRPARYVALAIVCDILALDKLCRHHRAVRLQAYGMYFPGADCLPVGDLLPEGETPLARVGIIAKLAIQDSRRTQIPRRFHGFRRSEAYRLRALRGVLVIARSFKLRRRAIGIACRQQFLCIGVVYCLYALCRILIISGQGKLCKRAAIVPRRKQRFRLGVVYRRDALWRIFVISCQGKLRKRAVIVPRRKQRFRVGIMRRKSALGGVLVIARSLELLRGLFIITVCVECLRFGVVDSWYPCRGVAVIAQRGESGQGGIVFAIGKQRFRVGVVRREGALRGVLVVAHGLEGLRGLRVFAARIEGFRRLIVFGGDEDLRDVPRRDGGDGDEKHDDDGNLPVALALFGFLPLHALFFRCFPRLQFLCFLMALLCACGAVLVILQALKVRSEASKIEDVFRLRLLPAKLLINPFPLFLRRLAESLGLAVGFIQRLGVGLARRFLCLRVAALRLLNAFVPAGGKGLFLRRQALFEGAGGKVARLCQIAVACKARLAEARRLPPVVRHRAVRLGRRVLGADGLFRQIIAHGKALRRRVDAGRVLLDRFFGRAFFLPFGLRDLLLRVLGDAACLHAGEEFAQPRLGALGVHVQRAVEELVRRLPVAVVQRHVAALEQRVAGNAARRLHDDRLRGLRRPLAQQLFHAAHQILHRAHLAHVLPLQVGKFLGHIVGVHALIAGNEVLFLPRGDEREEAAPLVFHPHGVEVFIVRAKYQHHLGGIERREDVRLVFRAQLVLQRDARKEHPQPLFRQGVVHLLRHDAVRRAFAVFVRLLVADEDVVGLFLAGQFHDAAADVLDGLRFLAVHLARNGVGVLLRLLKVRVFEDALKGRAVAGGDLFAGGGVVHVLDAVTTEDEAPVGLRLGGKFGDNAFIHRGRLVELASRAQAVGPRKERQFLLVVRRGHRLARAAVFALRHGLARFDVQISPAHFAFDDGHVYSSSRFGVVWGMSRFSSANSSASEISSLRVRPVLSAASSNACNISRGIRMDTTVDAAVYLRGVICNLGMFFLSNIFTSFALSVIQMYAEVKALQGVVLTLLCKKRFCSAEHPRMCKQKWAHEKRPALQQTFL